MRLAVAELTSDDSSGDQPASADDEDRQDAATRSPRPPASPVQSVQNAVIRSDSSLPGGLVGAAVWSASTSSARATVTASDPDLQRGSPTVLVRDGRQNPGALRRLGLCRADVVAACRRQGADKLSEIKEATLGPGGAIVVTLNGESATSPSATCGRETHVSSNSSASSSPAPSARRPRHIDCHVRTAGHETAVLNGNFTYVAGGAGFRPRHARRRLSRYCLPTIG